MFLTFFPITLLSFQILIQKHTKNIRQTSRRVQFNNLLAGDTKTFVYTNKFSKNSYETHRYYDEMSLTILKSTQQLSLHPTDALIGDNNDIIITNDLHTDTSHLTDNNSYGVSENSCSDNNDNSLNVTGKQNLFHICVGRDAYGDVSVVSEPYQQKQTQKKALNLNGNEMRHRKNLLFNLINAIMNYLGNSNKNSENNNRHEGNTMADDDRIDDSGVDDSSDKLMIMDEYDRLSSASSCDNRSNKKIDLNEKELEYAFSDETDVETLKDDQNERALVPEGDSFGVTLR